MSNRNESSSHTSDNMKKQYTIAHISIVAVRHDILTTSPTGKMGIFSGNGGTDSSADDALVGGRRGFVGDADSNYSNF